MYISSLYNQKLAMSSASKDPTSLDDEEPLKISKAMKSYITRANAHGMLTVKRYCILIPTCEHFPSKI